MTHYLGVFPVTPWGGGDDWFDLGDTMARYVNHLLNEDETQELFEHLHALLPTALTNRRPSR